jgi:hypothetical protein
VIVWDDVGKWRSVYMPAILKVERSQPYSGSEPRNRRHSD